MKTLADSSLIWKNNWSNSEKNMQTFLPKPQKSKTINPIKKSIKYESNGFCRGKNASDRANSRYYSRNDCFPGATLFQIRSNLFLKRFFRIGKYAHFLYIYFPHFECVLFRRFSIGKRNKCSEPKRVRENQFVLFQVGG